MTPALRTYHRRFWLGAAFILPALYLLAILAIPGRATDPDFHLFQPDALPEVLKVQESDSFLMRLRTDTDRMQWQLEVIVRKPLTTPEALVYLTGDPDAAAGTKFLLGKLSSAGIYRFALPGQPAQTTGVSIFNPFDGKTIYRTAL